MMLRTLSPEMFRLLEHARASGIGTDALSLDARRELDALMPWAGGSELICVLCALRNYGNGAFHARERRRILHTLHAQGVRLPEGRQPNQIMDKFVRDVVPVALAHGVRLGTGEDSRLVKVLRSAASHAGLKGDPRAALRRIVREG